MRRRNFKKTIIATCVALFAVVFMMPVAAQAPISEELAFLNLINNYRAQNGLGKLALSPRLSKAALGHSTDMANKNYFQHNSLNGATFKDRIKAAGYPVNTYLGENIAAGMSTANEVFNSWKKSPGHNQVMLGKSFKAIGIGRAYNANSTYKWYWTTDFGGVVDSPVTQVSQVSPANQATPASSQTQTTQTTVSTTTPPAAPAFDSWAFDYIQWLLKRGTMTGYVDGSFRPTRAVTRAEFAVLVVRAYEIPLGGGKVFRDTKDHWAQDHVAVLADRGCISGYVDGGFRPDRRITRAEMVKVLTKVASLKQTAGVQSFPDVANHWATPYIAAASSNGIVKGFVNGKFRPDTNSSRADAAACIYRLLNNREG